MINVSLLEKLKSFIEIIKNNEYTMYVIPILVILVFFVMLSCKMNDRIMKWFYIFIYIGILGTLIFTYHEEVLSLVDYLVENIVANLLFPNLAIYIGVLLVINVIILITLFSSKVKDYVKNINIVSFAIMQLFLFLIVDNIVTNDINVYEKLSIYTNQNLLILIELSMQLFIVWIGVLCVIKLIDYLIIKSENNVALSRKNKIKSIEEYEPIKEVSHENDEFKLEYEEYGFENEKDLEINYYEDYQDSIQLIEYVPIKKVKKNIN